MKMKTQNYYSCRFCGQELDIVHAFEHFCNEKQREKFIWATYDEKRKLKGLSSKYKKWVNKND